MFDSWYDVLNVNCSVKISTDAVRPLSYTTTHLSTEHFPQILRGNQSVFCKYYKSLCSFWITEILGVFTLQHSNGYQYSEVSLQWCNPECLDVL